MPIHPELLTRIQNNDPSLTSLNLSNYKIDSTEAIALAEALKTNQNLTYLDLSVNKISDTGATAIAEALKINQNLAHLLLTYTEISDTGATAIAEALKINKTLTHLHLSQNKIGDKGAAAITEALKVNQNLKILDLMSNLIGYTVAATMVEALKTNQNLTLCYLALWGNQIDGTRSVAIGEALKEYLTRNTHLTFIVDAIKTTLSYPIEQYSEENQPYYLNAIKSQLILPALPTDQRGLFDPLILAIIAFNFSAKNTFSLQAEHILRSLKNSVWMSGANYDDLPEHFYLKEFERLLPGRVDAMNLADLAKERPTPEPSLQVSAVSLFQPASERSVSGDLNTQYLKNTKPSN